MSELLHAQGEETDDDVVKSAKEAKEKLLTEAREGWLEFGRQFENTINGYFGTPDMRFTVKPGGWYVDLNKIEVNADPNFFLEKGYSRAEALFCTFHEAEHFRDMIQQPEEYTRLFDRIKARTDVHAGYPKALQTMWNCLEDVMVNRVVMNRWSSGNKAKDVLYPKLFPNTDLRGKPRHRQFMYALLRESMLPGEQMQLDPEVREAINKCNARPGGRGRTVDILTATDARGQARMMPRERFALMRTAFEPVFEAFYKMDLKDRKASDRKEKSEPGGEGEYGDPFGEDPEAEGIPDPIDFNEAAEQARRINEAISNKKKNEFKEAMGVDQADFQAYQEDYRGIESEIENLSKTFDEVIQRRKIYRRVLRKPTREGPMLDMHKVAIAVPMLDLGQEPVVMRDYERQEIIRNRPSELEFTLVCDGSGSMKGGAKERMQRRLAVLVAEGLADFRNRIAKQRREGDNIDLTIKSEVRVFSDSDEVVKPLSESLDHTDRVKMHKKLKALPGGGNNEPTTFIAIGQEQFNEDRLVKMASGDLKKVILFLTDGETDVAAIQAEIARLIEMAGPEGAKNLVIAGIGFEGGIQAIQTYAPNGYYAKTLPEVIDIFRGFLEKILEDL